MNVVAQRVVIEMSEDEWYAHLFRHLPREDRALLRLLVPHWKKRLSGKQLYQIYEQLTNSVEEAEERICVEYDFLRPEHENYHVISRTMDELVEDVEAEMITKS
jgi:hypothetical protein